MCVWYIWPMNTYFSFAYFILIDSCYLAHDHSIWQQETSKSHVYNFGVLLLEIVSGRSKSNKRLAHKDQILLEMVIFYSRLQLTCLFVIYLHSSRICFFCHCWFKTLLSIIRKIVWWCMIWVRINIINIIFCITISIFLFLDNVIRSMYHTYNWCCRPPKILGALLA